VRLFGEVGELEPESAWQEHRNQGDVCPSRKGIDGESAGEDNDEPSHRASVEDGWLINRAFLLLPLDEGVVGWVEIAFGRGFSFVWHRSSP
jgi:hypothetical protein